ncbi:hypothetical protein [Actinoplanes subglobosus]|uniref:Uncharacterized protein n=1 Tax=Actinoplanes subglobosus TaxID=1547892 RepID=A0ABV8IH50_9ACTN
MATEATVPFDCESCAGGATFEEMVVGGRLHWSLSHACPGATITSCGRDEPPAPWRAALLEQCGVYRLRIGAGYGVTGAGPHGGSDGRADDQANNRADRADDQTDNQADRADDQTDRADDRADNRADRADDRADNRADRADDRADNRADRADGPADSGANIRADSGADGGLGSGSGPIRGERLVAVMRVLRKRRGTPLHEIPAVVELLRGPGLSGTEAELRLLAGQFAEAGVDAEVRPGT